MDWLNLNIQATIRAPAYIGSSPAERGTWLSVIAYACEIECGGRLIGAAQWKDRQWQQACGVTLREVKAADRLLLIHGADVLVNGYPSEKERQVKQARGAGTAGAMARWGKGNGVSDGASMATAIQAPLAAANAEGEGERKEKGKGSAHALDGIDPDPLGLIPLAQSPTSPPPRNDDDMWRFEVGAMPFARSLVGAGAKIGARNWRPWAALVDQYGIDAVVAAAKGVPAEERWPDRTETALGKSRGQLPIAAALAAAGRKTVVLG